MLLSSLSGMKVICVKNAEYLGIFSGVVLDAETYVTKYIFTDTNMFVPFDDLIFGKDVLFSAHMGESAYAGTSLKISLGANLYSEKGKYLGKTDDLCFNSKRKYVLCENKKIAVNRIIAASGDYAILSAHGKKDRIYLTATEVQAIPAPQSASSSDNPVEPVNVAAEVQSENDTAVNVNPDDIGDYAYLIGKRTTKEVSDIGRSFVVMAGTLITDRLIQNAKKAGKLSEIASKSGE